MARADPVAGLGQSAESCRHRGSGLSALYPGRARGKRRAPAASEPSPGRAGAWRGLVADGPVAAGERCLRCLLDSGLLLTGQYRGPASRWSDARAEEEPHPMSVWHPWRCPATRIVLLALVLASGAGAVPVREVSILGLQGVPEQTVRAVISMREGTQYDPQLMQRDLRSILDLGLFDEHSSKVEPQAQPDGVRVRYTLVENPKIMKVQVDGATAVAPEAIIAAVTELVPEGSVLNRHAPALAVQRIHNLYAEQGFHMNMRPASFDRDGTLTLHIIEKSLAKVSVRVLGPSYVNPEIVAAWLGPPAGSLLHIPSIQAAADRGR